jgi:uncharacterized protein
MFPSNFPGPDDQKMPEGLPSVIDAHVHVFPDELFSAIRNWFAENAWPVRYNLSTSEIFKFLLSHGVDHIIALQYAHKPGLASYLNDYLIQQCSEFPDRVSGLATIFPGEPQAVQILKEAFDKGLAGVKLHAHVQCFDTNSPDMEKIYDLCQSENKPMVMHVGREPGNPAYLCDPYQLCGVDKLERVLRDFPNLKICVPHLGLDEIVAYKNLIEKYDTLWLDTTMMLADFFPVKESIPWGEYRKDRLLYGSDFPNIPYAWDKEIRRLEKIGFSWDRLEWLLYKSAVLLFSLKKESLSGRAKEG